MDAPQVKFINIFEMSELKLETKIWEVEIYDDDDARRGSVDVRFWLRGKSYDDVRGVVTVRVYFTDSSMTVEQIKAEAPVVAMRILKQTNELGAVEDYPEGLEERWQ